MQHCLSIFGRILLIYSFALPWAPPPARGGCVDVRDESYVMSSSSCGTNEWQLVASWDGGVETQFGPETAFGSCNGGYWNCNDVFVPQGYVNQPTGAQAHFRDLGPLGDQSESLEWDMDEFTVSYSSCNNGISRDEIEQVSNTQFPDQRQLDCV